MKRIYCTVLVIAMLCTGCTQTVSENTTGEDFINPITEEVEESVARTRVYGAFTVFYEGLIPDKNTNGETNVAMIVSDFQSYPYTIPYYENVGDELEQNRPYTFTIKDIIIEKPIEELEATSLSDLLWQTGIEVVSCRECYEDEFGLEQRKLQFETLDEKIYFEQYTKKIPNLNSIDEYFDNPHEHESCDDGYTKETDLNHDGKNEKITVEKLDANGGDGGYFPHVYSSDGDELKYQEDVYDSPFEIKWNNGAVTIYYLDDVLLELTKENVKDIYFNKAATEGEDLSSLEEEIMHAYDTMADCASGFVVTDDGEMLVKYLIQGAYGHFDALGYGVLHLTLDEKNQWIMTPEFVLD